MKQTVYLFDFDGTITTKDTLIEVIRYAVGTPRLLLGFLLFSPVLVLMKLHLYPNWKAKQRVFSYFFKGKTIEEFNQLCHDFASESRQLLRPKACYGQEKVNRIQKLLTCPRTELHIIAFGDSRGDREMLNYADEAYYKPFRS